MRGCEILPFVQARGRGLQDGDRYARECCAVPVQGQVVIGPMMYVALSYDHRIVDGPEAVQFLVRIKELEEDAGNLLLEI